MALFSDMFNSYATSAYVKSSKLWLAEVRDLTMPTEHPDFHRPALGFDTDRDDWLAYEFTDQPDTDANAWDLDFGEPTGEYPR